MGDVVMMRVYMAADPAMENKLDFAGMNAAYAKFFGTTEQPNKPARSTFQVAALVVGRARSSRSKCRRREANEPRQVCDGGVLLRADGVIRRVNGRAGSGAAGVHRRAGRCRQGGVRQELRLMPHAGPERRQRTGAAHGRQFHDDMGRQEHEGIPQVPCRVRCPTAHQRSTKRAISP